MFWVLIYETAFGKIYKTVFLAGFKEVSITAAKIIKIQRLDFL
jgi:hypothetical protein